MPDTPAPTGAPETEAVDHVAVQRFAAKVAEAPRSDLQRWTVQGNLRMLAEEVGYLVGLHRRGRWNIENTPSGVRLCRGDHDADWCEWEEYAPAERLRGLEAENEALREYFDACEAELQATQDFADGNTQSYNGGELRARIKHARLTILHLEPNR